MEIVLAIGILTGLRGMVFQSFVSLSQNTAEEAARSYATSKVRGAMDRLVLTIRNDFVHFNVVAGTPLGINLDLDGDALVRDGLLYYFDRNRSAQIFSTGANGEAQTTGLDDVDGDGFADVVGIGLVSQDLDGDGAQDFIDLNDDGLPDDLDGDGNPDPWWTLTFVAFRQYRRGKRLGLVDRRPGSGYES